MRNRDISDKEVWHSVNWFVNFGKFFPHFPDNIIHPIKKIEHYKPKICHRQLYQLVGANGQKYIFSPMRYADKKWTPMFEIYNYQLAQKMGIPEKIYIPHIFEGMVCQHHFQLGLGSFKVFVNLVRRDVDRKKELKHHENAWIIVFDYLISNIERDWSDHLSVDVYNTFILLDNDLGIEHAHKSTLPANNVLLQLKDTVVQNVLDLNVDEIDAPYNWIDFIKPRLQALKDQLKTIKKINNIY
jgi:hypothetical protein